MRIPRHTFHLPNYSRRLPAARVVLAAALACTAACDTAPPATATPILATQPATLAATPVFNPAAPQSEPTQFSARGQNDADAASVPSGSGLPPLILTAPSGGLIGQQMALVQVTADDGTALMGDFYSVPLGENDQRAPGVLLLAPDRAAWLDLPLRLQRQGLNVLSLTLRAPWSPELALADYTAVLNALAAIDTVDPGRLAVVGALEGGAMALRGCAADLLCDALAVFSPSDDGAGSITAYNPRPLFLALSGEEAGSFGNLRANATGPVEYETVETPQRGAGLLQASPAIGDLLLVWLNAALSG